MVTSRMETRSLWQKGADRVAALRSLEVEGGTFLEEEAALRPLVQGTIVEEGSFKSGDDGR